jgi:hypothetical protein
LIVGTKSNHLIEGQPGGRPSRADLYQPYAYVHRYDCQRAYLLYPQTAGSVPRDLDAMGRGDSHAGTVGVRFVDMRRRLWTREGRAALSEELAGIVAEALDIAAPDIVGAIA